MRWGAGEVEAVRVVVAFGLADGAVDLWFGNWVGEAYYLFEVKKLPAELYAFELVNEIQEINFILKLDFNQLLLQTIDNSKRNEHDRHLLLADYEVPQPLRELNWKVIEEQADEPLE